MVSLSRRIFERFALPGILALALVTVGGCGYRLAGSLDAAGLQGTAVSDVTGGNRGSETAAEYGLIGEVEFELRDAAGQTVISRRTISADAIYLRDATNVTGSIEEERLLRREIHQELTRRILTAVRVTSGGAAVEG